MRALALIVISLTLLACATFASMNSHQQDVADSSKGAIVNLGGESGNGKPSISIHDQSSPISLGGETGNGLVIKIVRVAGF